MHTSIFYKNINVGNLAINVATIIATIITIVFESWHTRFREHEIKTNIKSKLAKYNILASHLGFLINQ